MQTIYLTDTDELPKKGMQQTMKTPACSKGPKPKRNHLRDTAPFSKQNSINMNGRGIRAEKREINGMSFSFGVIGLQILHGNVIFT